MATAAFDPVSTGILVPAAAADQYPESFDKTFKQTLIRTVDGFDEQQYRERYADCELCLLYTSPSPRDATLSRMPSSA